MSTKEKPSRKRKQPKTDFSFILVSEPPLESYSLGQWAEYECIARQAMKQKLGRLQAKGLAQRYKITERYSTWTIKGIKIDKPENNGSFINILYHHTKPIGKITCSATGL